MLGKALVTAAAGNAAGEATYVEDVFSTYLYTGNGSTQTITNGIDLENKGGLAWIKARSSAAYYHILCDTERGLPNSIYTNVTAAEDTVTSYISSFNANGFSLPSASATNANGTTYASWTFAKQEKFFDIVTYTGDGNTEQAVAHNLGVAPACYVIKQTNSTGDWWFYTTVIDGSHDYSKLNTTNAFANSSRTLPTSTHVYPGNILNTSGGEYVIYMWANNNGDGIFGENGDQDIIKCGSYEGGQPLGTEINVGFEPQWLLIRNADNGGHWQIYDNMQGISTGSNDNFLKANATDATESNERISLTATGFKLDNTIDVNTGAYTFIYIAIRRGPMKTPESGTEVFSLADRPGGPYEVGFPADMALWKWRSGSQSWRLKDRLRGATAKLETDNTSAEASLGTASWDLQNYIDDTNFVDATYYMGYYFGRSPGFFDVVAYTGDGTNGRTINHNLSVEPEFIIIKNRSSAENWITQAPGPIDYTSNIRLNGNTATSTNGQTFLFTSGNSTSLTTGPSSNSFINTSGQNYILYLFASVPGVSKVGSYTGNGTSQTIDCGFSTGARFVLIKRTDSTSNWNLFDTERGIVAGNDPRLELNTTDAEDTGDDGVDPDSSGFAVNYIATNDDDVNVSGGTYIFLAIA